MTLSDQTDLPWDKLHKRTEAFRLILDLLPGGCRIVETGTIRMVDNWAGDGQSTVVWNTAAEILAGSVITVDIDPVGAQLVEQLELDRTSAVTADSVATLRSMYGPVDLLYLDSFDINFANPEPAQKHHLREIAAAWHLLRRGSLVAVDDNLDHAGKGHLVAEFLAAHDATELLSGYVRVWRI